VGGTLQEPVSQALDQRNSVGLLGLIRARTPLLFPRKVDGSKKRSNVMEVWSWSGAQLDASRDLLTLLDYGVGRAGQAFNSQRDRELTFAIRLVQQWKQARDLPTSWVNEPWGFGSWVDPVPGGEKRQFRHMILSLLFPDFYERVWSGRHTGSEEHRKCPHPQRNSSQSSQSITRRHFC
jgi:hypothetical protein